MVSLLFERCLPKGLLFLKPKFFIALGVLSGTRVSAELMKSICLSKSTLYGQPKGEVFSDEDVLTTQIDEKMRLYAYYECNDEQGNF